MKRPSAIYVIDDNDIVKKFVLKFEFEIKSVWFQCIQYIIYLYFHNKYYIYKYVWYNLSYFSTSSINNRYNHRRMGCNSCWRQDRLPPMWYNQSIPMVKNKQKRTVQNKPRRQVRQIEVSVLQKSLPKEQQLRRSPESERIAQPRLCITLYKSIFQRSIDGSFAQITEADDDDDVLSHPWLLCTEDE